MRPGIHRDEAGGKGVGEYIPHLLKFTLAQESMVHKDAGQLVPNGLGKQRSRHRAVHAAGQSQQDGILSDRFPQQLNLLLCVAAHLPVPGAAANIQQKVLQDAHAVLRMRDLRMKLNAVEFLLFIRHGRDGTGFRPRHGLKAFRQLNHLISMAHPAGVVRLRVRQNGAEMIHPDMHQAVFPLFRCGNLSAQHMPHQLHAVANAEDRDAQLKDFLRASRRVRIQHAGRAAAEDDSHGRNLADGFQGRIAGQNLGVNVMLPHPAGDQLGILSAEIQNQNAFLPGHGVPPVSWGQPPPAVLKYEKM